MSCNGEDQQVDCYPPCGLVRPFVRHVGPRRRGTGVVSRAGRAARLGTGLVKPGGRGWQAGTWGSKRLGGAGCCHGRRRFCDGRMRRDADCST